MNYLCFKIKKKANKLPVWVTALEKNGTITSKFCSNNYGSIVYSAQAFLCQQKTKWHKRQEHNDCRHNAFNCGMTACLCKDNLFKEFFFPKMVYSQVYIYQHVNMQEMASGCSSRLQVSIYRDAGVKNVSDFVVTRSICFQVSLFFFFKTHTHIHSFKKIYTTPVNSSLQHLAEQF